MDQYLVAKVLSGDTNAFGIIIKNTEGLVVQIIFKMISNAEDRKDLVQDVYLKVFKNLPGFRFQSKLSTWIAQITYNSCFSYLEKKKPLLLDSLYDKGESNIDEDDKEVGEFNFSNPTETTIFQIELNAILKAEIEGLAPLQKTLITLYHNEELSYEEIAQITQLPEGTVKSYLFRARKVLKDRLLCKYKKEEL